MFARSGSHACQSCRGRHRRHTHGHAFENLVSRFDLFLKRRFTEGRPTKGLIIADPRNTAFSSALAANNHLSALGNTKGNLVQVALTANTDLRSVEEFKNLVLRQQNNAIVRIRDIADVELGAEDYETDVKLSGQTAVFMGIFVLPTANSLDVIRRVREKSRCGNGTYSSSWPCSRWRSRTWASPR